MNSDKTFKVHSVRMTPPIIALYIVLVSFCTAIFTPLLTVISSSFRRPENMTSHLVLFQEFTFESYIKAYERMDYPAGLFNSVLITGLSVLVLIMLATAAAYPICRIKMRSSRFLYFFFISGLIIPAQMVIIPIAQMFNRLNIPNSRFTPIVMFVTCSIPFSIFLFVGFMKSIPIDIEESAYLDGCGSLKRFLLIVFPLLKPAVISATITQGMWIWNDYFFSMVFLSKQSEYTLPIGMIQFMGDKENPAQWNVLFAACILCVFPLILIFIIMQKQFVNGIAAGAVKG